MKLTEMAQPKKVQARKALREHFEVDINFATLDAKKTKQMLNKIRGLLKETRSARTFTRQQANPSYLKLVMMEQALAHHFSDVRIQSRIVTENEEVEKSQVILAAQDMVDQVQKMIEQVSKMNAEELPAVVDGVSNEIGTAESETYNQATAEALTTLLSALTTAKGALSSALGQVTGQGGGEAPAFGGDEGMPGGEAGGLGDEMGGAAGGEAGMGEPGGELPELPEPEEEPEEFGNAGREMR